VLRELIFMISQTVECCVVKLIASDLSTKSAMKHIWLSGKMLVFSGILGLRPQVPTNWHFYCSVSLNLCTRCISNSWWRYLCRKSMMSPLLSCVNVTSVGRESCKFTKICCWKHCLSVQPSYVHRGVWLFVTLLIHCE